MQQQKALIAMSGGVDSSVAAHLIRAAGYDCIGGTMRLYEEESACHSLTHVKDAESVADKLGIPFRVFSFSEDFRCKVIDTFVREYEQGRTPNPCVECNRHLKFDRLLSSALELGCDYIVTGHYARIGLDDKTGRYFLRKAVDEAKDQSYFLYGLTQEQLSHILLPLGDLEKSQVRQIAQEQGFATAKKKDSQDVCFIPDGDYLAFLTRYTGRSYPAGDFLDRNGNIVGRHKGAVGYTLGQRKGLGLAMGEPVYVCSKDMTANTVTVGSNEDLMRTTLLADNWYWHRIPSVTEPIRVKAKARSRMNEEPATVYPEENGIARVVFDKPQRALTPGQAVVLYDGDAVLGGGTIIEVL